jgi:hypothetical protein
MQIESLNIDCNIHAKIPVEINLYEIREKVNHESLICTLQKKHGDLKGEL